MGASTVTAAPTTGALWRLQACNVKGGQLVILPGGVYRVGRITPYRLAYSPEGKVIPNWQVLHFLLDGYGGIFRSTAELVDVLPERA